MTGPTDAELADAIEADYLGDSTSAVRALFAGGASGEGTAPRPDPRLTALMEGCAQALYEDREWNAPQYRDGEIVGSNGTNACEAAEGLDAVAAVLGLTGPTALCDAMWEADDA